MGFYKIKFSNYEVFRNILFKFRILQIKIENYGVLQNKIENYGVLPNKI